MNRQQARRGARKVAKRMMLQSRRDSAAAALKQVRDTRDPKRLPKRHPGKLLPTMRAFDKPHGQASWRVRDMPALLDGSPIPAGCEASFHSTKGLRVVRLHA